MSSTTVRLILSVDIAPIPPLPAGIVCGSKITVKWTSDCDKQLTNQSPSLAEDVQPLGGGSKNVPKAIGEVTVVLGNNAFSIAVMPLPRQTDHRRAPGTSRETSELRRTPSTWRSRSPPKTPPTGRARPVLTR